MTFKWERRHSVVFTVLLMSQAAAWLVSASRGAFDTSSSTFRVPVIYLPAFIVGLVFMATFIVVTIWDAIRTHSRNLR
jgi:hypothetical protein